MWHHAQLPFDFCLILFFTVCICEWVSELRCSFVLQCVEKGQLSRLSFSHWASFSCFCRVLVVIRTAVHSLLVCLSFRGISLYFPSHCRSAGIQMGPAKSVFLHWAISLTLLHVCSAGNRAHSLKYIRQFEFFCWCAGGLISQDRVSLYLMLSWNLHYRADWLQTSTSSSWVQAWRPEQPHTWLGVSFLHWVATSMSVCLFVGNLTFTVVQDMGWNISALDNRFDLVGFWGKVLYIA